MNTLDDLGGLFEPPRLLTREEALSRPCPIPQNPGIYAWYFDQAPPGINTTGCHKLNGCSLLYVGIAPKGPTKEGRKPRTLRKRLKEHFAMNAEGSTLRLTLGCLLRDQLGIELRRVGSGNRYTFTNPGERLLDGWLNDHASVAFVECERPWEVERHLLASDLLLPLNIHGRPPGSAVDLSALRSSARKRADQLPVVADSGGPRRLIAGHSKVS